MTLQEAIARLRQARNTRRGQNILTYAVFLLVATGFWFLMVLNDDVQRNYTVAVAIENLPENFTPLNQQLPEISTIVKSKGRSQLKYSFGATPTLKLSYNDFKKVDDSRMVINLQGLDNHMRTLFGNDAEIVAMRPDSISVSYTTLPGDRLPVYSKVEATAAPQYIIYGNIKVEPDSVLLFSPRNAPVKIGSLSTDKIVLRNLTDTTSVEVEIHVPGGCRAVPSKVRVTIPAEPLIAKQREIKIAMRNLPHDTDLITFPPTTKVSYLLPMSLYRHDSYVPQVYVDYNETWSDAMSLPVHIGTTPDYYRNVEVSPRSVEYIIEHNAK